MINIQAEQRIQSIDLESLKSTLDDHQENASTRLDAHEERIRTLELEISPKQSLKTSSQ